MHWPVAASPAEAGHSSGSAAGATRRRTLQRKAVQGPAGRPTGRLRSISCWRSTSSSSLKKARNLASPRSLAYSEAYMGHAGRTPQLPGGTRGRERKQHLPLPGRDPTLTAALGKAQACRDQRHCPASRTCSYSGGRRLERRFHSFKACRPKAAGTHVNSLFCSRQNTASSVSVCMLSVKFKQQVKQYTEG
jgi:hypothetical protein